MNIKYDTQGFDERLFVHLSIIIDQPQKHTMTLVITRDVHAF